jgi:class 3 adenylate cyclase/tetratricopeptide (TPR) repeat protein
MDVGGWLRGLGLEQYEAAFRENRIDDTVLPKLTAEDLKDLGVGFVGDRRKLLDAIAGLHAEASAPSLSDGLAIDNAAKDTAERRQVTVMFSDMVGSTALSGRMDPEDLRHVLSAYQKCVADSVQRFGGFVAKYMGDGVLVYFGYPQAHEDDAERAVRAGLELVSAATELDTHTTVQTRVGIATGLVIVGDLIGSGASQEQAIVGETPNLAARLQGSAEPNTVIIAEGTRNLLGDLFELDDLGPRELKGITGSVRAWAALRPSSVESRFEAYHVAGMTELVGRENELEVLLRCWSSAKTSEGQVVLLSGEAGIGKSRLTAALLERVASEPHTRLRYFCSPRHTDSALHPIINHMERAAGFRLDDTPEVKRDKLDSVLARTSTSIEDIALLAEMLSLPNDGRYPALSLPPQQQRQRTLQALVSQIEALTRQSQVLIVFEDAHWTDPTSLEVLGLIMERIQTLPVLLIVTFRPEFEPPWIGRPHVTSLMINRLAQRETVSLIDRVVGGRMLPASLRQDIVERTDGIPLFVEEMTKAVLEAESEGEARRTAAVIPSPLAVPASLHQSLMARLDRLGPAKEVAQIGSVIGREFSHALLVAVTRRPEAKLQSALDRLITAGLLFRQGGPPHATYLFKHALVQDAAYGTLLRDKRRTLHARIAQMLETQFPELAENQPELLARHWTEAGQIEKAAYLWGKAGQRSLQRSALIEAIAQFTRSLDQIATLPGTPVLRSEQIRLQVAVINPLIHTKGFAALETKAAVERSRLLIEQAEALGEAPVDPLLLFSVLYGLWVANIAAFNGDALREVAAEFLALAEQGRATIPLMIGHRLTGATSVFTGDFQGARAYLDRAIALYDPAEHRPLAVRFGVDVRNAALCHRSWALWMLGHPVAALADADFAIKDAREFDQAATLIQALILASYVQIFCGNFAVAMRQVDEGLALADEKGAVFWRTAAMILRGWVFWQTGKASDVVQALTTGYAAFGSTGAQLHTPLSFSYLAQSYAELGRLDDAWRCRDEAMAAMETTKERLFEAEVLRVAGEIALMSPEQAKAEAFFERALTVARSQQAKSWELRAAMSMARLWRDQGKPQQARELLAPIYGWFTEGFDTRDLKEAKVLLDELGS